MEFSERAKAALLFAGRPDPLQGLGEPPGWEGYYRFLAMLDDRGYGKMRARGLEVKDGLVLG